MQMSSPVLFLSKYFHVWRGFTATVFHDSMTPYYSMMIKPRYNFLTFFQPALDLRNTLVLLNTSLFGCRQQGEKRCHTASFFVCRCQFELHRRFLQCHRKVKQCWHPVWSDSTSWCIIYKNTKCENTWHDWLTTNSPHRILNEYYGYKQVYVYRSAHRGFRGWSSIEVRVEVPHRSCRGPLKEP